MPNQTVKNKLKRSNWPKWFFSWKATNKIFMYLWAPFIVQKFQSQFGVSGMCHFGAEMTHWPWTNLFWYKPLLLPSSTYWQFFVFKIKKTLLQQLQSHEDTPFLNPKWSLCPKHFFFFGKKYNIIFIYLLTPFTAKNF